ncbi:GIY-YIG nuclease family protein [Pedobacter petrophilus]|uniref:GIY-YIG nuclease family protein n=1 Tax=Pedobacter petrophilus TaxID=1908241 RepID=A0A7K0G3X6_9SPHI|nr:GIY-YIG nuclease family protein [Pedobacter petrophilus]MRX78094.1 GIY-YIG nuclease family protein [Pedobacter petrophilus]
MATVYILFSGKLNRFYTGSCLDVLERLQSHKDKIFTDSFTSKTDDWELFFTINDLDYKQFRLIELHIKKMKSVIYIKNLKQYPELVAKLIERYR